MGLWFSASQRAAILTATVVFAAGCAPNTVIAESNDAGPSDAGPSDAGPSDAGRPAKGTPIANSVADFSLVQGERNWRYGYVEPATSPEFQLMTQIATVDGYMPPSGEAWPTWAVQLGQYWTKIFELGAHANGVITSEGRQPVDQYAVRRWTSSVDGSVTLTGELAKIDTTASSNGVDARIAVDQVVVYSQFVKGDDSSGYAFEVPVTVHVGSTVDFVLDSHAQNDVADLTRFTAAISY